MTHNPGDVCQLSAASIQSPVNESFEEVQARFLQNCLTSDHVALMEKAKTTCYGKPHPCVILEKHDDTGSCTVTLFCTFKGEDINSVALVYRCFALSVSPTTRVPDCPAEEYALEKDIVPLHTTPEWILPWEREDVTKFKDQWVLTYPLTLTGKDITNLHPWRGLFSVENSELDRLLLICKRSHDTFIEQFDSPAKLKTASKTFMMRILIIL